MAWHVVASNPHPVVMPEPSGILTFGAVGSFSLLGWRGPGPQLAVLALALAVAVAWWRAPLLRDWRPAPDQQRAWLHFILAGTLLAGCFVVGQHYAYRWVFAIWLAPLLWILPRDPAAPAAVRRLARALAGLLLLQLWAEAGFVFLMHQRPHPEMVTLSRTLDLALQLPRWAFFLGLSGFIVHFVRLGWANLRTAR